MSKNNKTKTSKVKVTKILGKIFVWLALILMVGSVIVSIISPLLWS